MAAPAQRALKAPVPTEIREFVDSVVAQFRPARVILFGSYAAGVTHPESDVDLLVVMPRGKSGPAVATAIRLACPRSFPLDLIVRTQVQLYEHLRQRDPFFTAVVATGVLLHDDSTVNFDPQTFFTPARLVEIAAASAEVHAAGGVRSLAEVEASLDAQRAAWLASRQR